MKKRILSICLTLALCLGLLPGTALAAGIDTGRAIQLVDSGTAANIGGGQADNIYFGTYQQSSDGNRGYNTDPVKWRVLENADGQLFLLSDQNLDVFQYHTDYESVTWEKSTMRSWLNGYGAEQNTGGNSGIDYTSDNFIDHAFSEKEQAAIADTEVVNDDNPDYDTEGGNNTTDKIFLLSIADANNSYYFTNENSRKATNTAYVAGGGKISSGVMSDVGNADYWWLRSPGSGDGGGAAYVGPIGGVGSLGSNVDCAFYAVRPAFHLDLKSVLFTSAAVGGKSVNGMGSELTAVNDYTGNEWKLTLLDESRDFSISNATITSTNNTITFSYSNAQTGTNEYISAVIEDNGTITHYGRILQLDGTTNGANGTVSLALPEGVTLGENTKLYVFNEQYNGGANDDTKWTDYASKLIEVNPTIDDTAPTLTAGDVSRNSETAATVKFTSSEAGTYYYEVVESGTAAPTIGTTGAGTSCDTTEQTIFLDSLTTGAKDIYIVAKDTVGNISQPLTIEIPAYITPSYGISASPAALDFGSKTVGYTEAPAAKEVTITNTGNQTVTITLPTSTNYTITAGTGFENGSAALAPNDTAAFTVQPKAGLAVGTYSENITVSGTGGATSSISASFTVNQYSGGGGGGSSTPSQTPSQQAVDKIKDAQDGDTVKITLPADNTKLDKEVFEELAGRDVTLVISLPGGITWTVNGQDIPESANLTDLDLGVSMNTSTIPVDLINAVTGEVGTVQLTLAHNGAFGFTMTLTAPVGEENAGLWANLYHYDEDAGKMVFQTAALVDEDGNVALPFDHASEYAIILDSKSHELPFTDLAADAWYEDAVAYVYRRDLMAGYGDNLFGPDNNLTRAQLCQIVYNMESQPAASGGGAFTDVADGAWYADAVTWAASQGIVGGYGGGLFGPEDNITREQLAAILYRYAQAKGYDVSIGEDTNILSYADALKIGEYAIPAMQWACGAGILEGSDGSLHPQSDATRAETAAMLMRFCEKFV